MDPLAIDIIGGLTVAAITSLVSLLIGRRFFKVDTPLPAVPGSAPKEAFQFLNGQWHEYHITRDAYLNEGKPYWLKDTWELQVKKGYQITGTLKLPRSGKLANYKLLGEIRLGRMIITSANSQDPTDFFAAIFPVLTGKGESPIVGTMIAFDWNGEFYTGPMILSKSERNLEEVTKVVNAAQPVDFFAERDIDWLRTSMRPSEEE